MSKRIERSAIVGFSAEQMFDLVNDVESYPSFMSGCSNATLIERGDGWLIAKLELSKAGVHHTFTTRNELYPPERMTLELVDGPFKVFRGAWQFQAIDENACRVEFQLEYEFANFLLGLAAGKMMAHLATEQVDAVCQRAHALYG